MASEGRLRAAEQQLAEAQQWVAWFAAAMHWHATGHYNYRRILGEQLDRCSVECRAETRRDWDRVVAAEAKLAEIDSLFREWDADYPRGIEGVRNLMLECESHVADCRAAEAKLAAVRALLDNIAESGPVDHEHSRTEGYPECGACVIAAVRAILDRRESVDG